MAESPEAQLIKAAWALSRNNGDLWTRFLGALDVYTRDRIDGSIKSPTAELSVSVGMARQALYFNLDMHALDEKYKKLLEVEGKNR